MKQRKKAKGIFKKKKGKTGFRKEKQET